jgi:hypothetical protein
MDGRRSGRRFWYAGNKTSLMEILTNLVGPLLGGIAAYVAIRSDLAALTARMSNVEKTADSAHERIDSFWRGNK